MVLGLIATHRMAVDGTRAYAKSREMYPIWAGSYTFGRCYRPVVDQSDASDAAPEEDRPRSPIVLRSGDGEHVGLGRLLVGDRSAEGRFALIEMEGRPNVRVPPHIHRDADELFYLLEGRLIVQVGLDEVEAGPGDMVLVPRGVSHGHLNEGDARVRWLTLFAPGGVEGYFRERAHAGVRARGLPEAERARLDYAGLDPAEHDRLRERYGIVIVEDPGPR